MKNTIIKLKQSESKTSEPCGFCAPVATALAPASGSVDGENEFDDSPCWCGETRPYYAPLPSTCGGTGTINCFCGGDFCVCHWHGETECFGCPDCENEDYSDDED